MPRSPRALRRPGLADMAESSGSRGELEATAAPRSLFEFFAAITPDLTGAQRAELFARLPVELQQEVWESLDRALEARA